MRIALASLLFLSLAASCGAGRTAAATQPTPKAFDPAASDPQAVAIADQVIAAYGGEAAWAKAKELRWDHAVLVDGKFVYMISHDWDRWNGRHQMAKHREAGGASVVQYDIYEGTGNAYVSARGGKERLTRAGTRDMMAEGKTRLWADSYMLVLPFKLKDPGVHLKHKGERGEDPAVPKWDIIRVTFDSGVASTPADIYELAVNKQTHLIDIVDKIVVEAGQEKAIGYALDGWTDVAGIKVATRWLNIGYGKDSPMQPIEVPEAWQGMWHLATVIGSDGATVWKTRSGDLGVPPGLTAPVPGEIVFLLNVKVDAEPDDELYVPAVSEPGR